MSKTEKIINTTVILGVVGFLTWGGVAIYNNTIRTRKPVNEQIVSYVCPSGRNIKAAFHLTFVTVTTMDDSTVKLKRLPGTNPTGFTNENGSFMFWDKGTYAKVTHNNITETCINKNDLAEVRADEREIKKMVTEFGLQLHRVASLFSNVAHGMVNIYSPYVEFKLLTKWEQNPSMAPGRRVSGARPDHLLVTSVRPKGKIYAVDATLVLKSDNSNSHAKIVGRKHIKMTVTKQGGKWKIASYSVVGATAPPEKGNEPGLKNDRANT